MIKKLIDLPSGNKAEAVYFEDDRKQVICFSTQINCAVGCGFCASTGKGKTVNLTVADMAEQIMYMDTYVNTNKIMLYSIMGEGEPFLNYDNVIKIMHILEDRPNCKIAVSTSGYKIRKFAHEKFKVPVKLQVSVHGASSLVRKALVPNAPNIAQIRSDLKYYHKHNDGKVELNFALIKGLNDSKYDMNRIIDKFPNEHIKISKVNGSAGDADHEGCIKYLQDAGMSVEYYESDGAEIAAGCGQTSGVCQVESNKDV